MVAQAVKNLPAMQETWIPSLDLENPSEKEMATDSSIIDWRIPWTEEPGRLQSEVAESDTTKQLTFAFLLTLPPKVEMALEEAQNAQETKM